MARTGTGSARQVSRRDITAFRVARNGLGRRPDPGTPLADLVPLGLQDTTVGSVAQALAVRLSSPGSGYVENAARAGDLVPSWGPRLTATLVPPETETLVSAALLDPNSNPTNGSADLTRALAPVALDRLREHGPMSKAELGEAMAGEVPAAAMVQCEPCGRTHPSEGVVKMLVWTNRIRLEPVKGTASRFAPAARWRPRPYRSVSTEHRAEMVRHYLRRLGPSTPADLAAWAGIEPAYAHACWQLVEGELAAVRTADAVAWCLDGDRDELFDPPPLPSARLVPAYDPLLQLRDRATLIPDAGDRRAVWRSVANPGVVLVDGEVIATWRARRQTKRVEVTVTPLGAAGSESCLASLEEDLHALASAMGRDHADLVVG